MNTTRERILQNGLNLMSTSGAAGVTLGLGHGAEVFEFIAQQRLAVLRQLAVLSPHTARLRLLLRRQLTERLWARPLFRREILIVIELRFDLRSLVRRKLRSS